MAFDGNKIIPDGNQYVNFDPFINKDRIETPPFTAAPIDTPNWQQIAEEVFRLLEMPTENKPHDYKDITTTNTLGNSSHYVPLPDKLPLGASSPTPMPSLLQRSTQDKPGPLPFDPAFPPSQQNLIAKEHKPPSRPLPQTPQRGYPQVKPESAKVQVDTQRGYPQVKPNSERISVAPEQNPGTASPTTKTDSNTQQTLTANSRKETLPSSEKHQAIKMAVKDEVAKMTRSVVNKVLKDLGGGEIGSGWPTSLKTEIALICNERLDSLPKPEDTSLADLDTPTLLKHIEQLQVTPENIAKVKGYRKEVERRLSEKNQNMDTALDTKSKIGKLSYIFLHGGVISKLKAAQAKLLRVKFNDSNNKVHIVPEREEKIKGPEQLPKKIWTLMDATIKNSKLNRYLKEDFKFVHEFIEHLVQTQTFNNKDELKNQLKTMIQEKNEGEEELTGDQFKKLYKKRIEIQNSPQWEELNNDIKEGKWPNDEERELTTYMIPPENINEFMQVIDALFEDSEGSAWIDQIISENKE